ncbi:hypothetical protein LTS10_001306 [Elasticomyces elasticus]|nr:hypothetical protein LTS10_001306 [Elasticomyces elasticus]
MAAHSPDDELLMILLANLRCAEASFGAGTPPCESIRTTIEEHVISMRVAGLKTNLTSARGSQDVASATTSTTPPKSTASPFSNLAYRRKPSS